MICYTYILPYDYIELTPLSCYTLSFLVNTLIVLWFQRCFCLPHLLFLCLEYPPTPIPQISTWLAASILWASLIAQFVKNPLALQETPQFDSWVGKIPWRRERLPPPVFQPGELHGLYMGSQRVRHNWVNFTFTQFLKCLLINEAFSKIWSPIPTYTSIPLPCFVIKPKLILLATWQASKSRDELLGERMATYLESQKTKKMGDSCLQRTILPELEFRLLLY